MHTGHISVTVDSFDRIELSANVQRRPGGANSFLSLGNDSQRFTNESFVCIELEEQRLGPLTPISARIVRKDECHSNFLEHKKIEPSPPGTALPTHFCQAPDCKGKEIVATDKTGRNARGPELTLLDHDARGTTSGKHSIRHTGRRATARSPFQRPTPARVMHAHKKCLRGVNGGAYTFPIAETTAIRASRLDQIQADNRHQAVFFRPAFARLLQWRALAEGTPSGVPASCIAGPRTPKPCACHPIFAEGLAGFRSADTGGRTMRQAPARSEQTSLPNTLTQIVNDALRAAAVESTPNGAIDTLADALIRLASIARAEVSHG